MRVCGGGLHPRPAGSYGKSSQRNCSGGNVSPPEPYRTAAAGSFAAEERSANPCGYQEALHTAKAHVRPENPQRGRAYRQSLPAAHPAHRQG